MSTVSAAAAGISFNPLLQKFVFPPFDVVDADHVRPGIRELLRRLESDLKELERTVEPSWPKLVDLGDRISLNSVDFELPLSLQVMEMDDRRRPCFFKDFLPGLSSEFMTMPPTFWQHMESELPHDVVSLKGPAAGSGASTSSRIPGVFALTPDGMSSSLTIPSSSATS